MPHHQYKTGIDDISVSRQASFGGVSEEILMDVLGIESPWKASSFSKGMHEQFPDFRDNHIKGEVVIEPDIERRKHPCHVCGCLCKVHQHDAGCCSHVTACRSALMTDLVLSHGQTGPSEEPRSGSSRSSASYMQHRLYVMRWMDSRIASFQP